MLAAILVFFCVLEAISIIFLVLIQSGKDSGLSGAFGVGQSQFGSTQVMQKNAVRITVVVSLVFVANVIALGFVLP